MAGPVTTARTPSAGSSRTSFPGAKRALRWRLGAALDFLIDAKLGDFAGKSRRSESHGAVGSPAADDQHLRLDRHRKNKAVVVIGVLADQIDASGRADHVQLPARAELRGKFVLQIGER